VLRFTVVQLKISECGGLANSLRALGPQISRARQAPNGCPRFGRCDTTRFISTPLDIAVFFSPRHI
jgi:hypothetical protein